MSSLLFIRRMGVLGAFLLTAALIVSALVAQSATTTAQRSSSTPQPAAFLPLLVYGSSRQNTPTPAAISTPTPAAPTPAGTRTATPGPAQSPTITPTPVTTDTQALRTINFVESAANFTNPERGFYWPVDIFANDSFDYPRTQFGVSLVRSYARLDAYRNQDLPQALLDTFDVRMNAARSAGVKIVLRFAYNFGPYPNSQPDASLAWIKRHIEQLAPHLQRHADVIAWMEAGFIGAWGEWHSSTNGLDNAAAKQEVATALLAALPVSRSIQLRYPTDMLAIAGPGLGNGEAHSGSNASRIGHHNDCFLASADDNGTYERGNQSAAQEKAMIAIYGRYAPIGGETCGSNPPRSNCPTALAELEQLGFSDINLDYEPAVIQGWRDGGCFDTIQRRLGYRLWLESVTLPWTLRRSNPATLTLRIKNSGYAAPVNARPVFLILSGPGAQSVKLAVEPRKWTPGQTHVIAATFSVSESLPAGRYTLSLWMPDESASIREDARFAIQLANSGVWSATDGRNRIATDVVVE